MSQRTRPAATQVAAERVVGVAAAAAAAAARAERAGGVIYLDGGHVLYYPGEVGRHTRVDTVRIGQRAA